MITHSSPALVAGGRLAVGIYIYRLELKNGGPCDSTYAFQHPEEVNDTGAVSAFAVSSTALAASPWPKFRADARNSGRTAP